MSPVNTCHNCGSSSIEYVRQKRAKALVTRGSGPVLNSGTGLSPSFSMNPREVATRVESHIVRNFSIQNARPNRPTRRCATNGEFPDSRKVIAVTAARNGSSRTHAARETTRSAAEIALVTADTQEALHKLYPCLSGSNSKIEAAPRAISASRTPGTSQPLRPRLLPANHAPLVLGSPTPPAPGPSELRPSTLPAA